MEVMQEYDDLHQSTKYDMQHKPHVIFSLYLLILEF